MSSVAASAGTGRLKGRTAFVTGAAGGLGRAIAQRFADEGAKVAVVDLQLATAQAAARAIGTQHIGLQCDVSNEEQVEAAVSDTIRRFGQLDIVVSNAGHQFIAPIVQMPFAEWRKMLAVHMDGAFLLTRAALRHMIARGNATNGKIILMGSVHSKEASLYKAPYVAAKHGIVGLARAVAKEAGPYGISCNVVCPGFVRTPLVDKQIPEQAAKLGISDADVIKKVMLVNTVDGEFTTTDDIAAATLFFAAHPNNALTGQSLVVSHGWHMS
jgi:3-hydroxybutyrate dehydrogenase